MTLNATRRVVSCVSCGAETHVNAPNPGRYVLKCGQCQTLGVVEVPLARPTSLAHGQRVTTFSRVARFTAIRPFQVVYRKFDLVAEYVPTNKWQILGAYFLVTLVAEAVTATVSPLGGLLLHSGLLLALLAHAGLLWNRSEPMSRLITAMTLLPLIRIVSLTTPIARMSYIQWFLVLGVIMFVALFAALRVLRPAPDEIRLQPPTARGWPWEIGVALLGIPLGVAEYLIVKPGPVLDTVAFPLILGPALVMIVCGGYLEEAIFRGLLPHYLRPAFGTRGGIVVPALVSAVLVIGFGSFPLVSLVFATGLAYGAVAQRTGSVVGVGLSHGLANVLLFLVLPVTGLPWG